MKKKNKKKSGFTLIEILITSAIMIVALVSTLGLFGYLLSAADGDRSFAIAQYEAQSKMESICALGYATIRNGDAVLGVPAYTNNGAKKGTPFDITDNLLGRGAVYAEELPDATNGLMRVKVVVCYQDRDRTVGEDVNFNGILDVAGYGAEDANNNGEIDSPCEIETVLANKGT